MWTLLLLTACGSLLDSGPLRLAVEGGPLARAQADGGFTRAGLEAPPEDPGEEGPDCAVEAAPSGGRIAAAALGAPGLLTCTRAALEGHREDLVKLLAAYAARVEYERGLPARERRRMDPGEGPLPEYVLTATPGGDGALVEQALALASTLPRPYPALAHRLIEGSPPARLIAVIDGDGDGRLSYEEFSDVVRFQDPEEYDINADGSFDEAEVWAMLLKVSPLLSTHRGFGKVANEKLREESLTEFEARVRNLNRYRGESE